MTLRLSKSQTLMFTGDSTEPNLILTLIICHRVNIVLPAPLI